MTLNGTTYKKKLVVVLNIENEEPTFGEIVDVLQNQADETLFVMQKLRTVGFSVHHHAYEVARTPFILFSTQRDFSDHHPLHVSKSFFCVLEVSHPLVIT